MLYYRAGSAASRLAPADVDAAAGLFTSARWLHLTGITPALSEGARAATLAAVERARASRLTISLDINLRRRLWPDGTAATVLRSLAARVDVVLGSPDEAAVVGGSASDDPAALAQTLLALGPSTAVIKLGAGGSLGQERGGRPVHRSALPVATVVDPVGAGDAFCAGFIDARLGGASLERALDAGNACGAAAVSSLGDLAGLPDQRELARLLAMGDSRSAPDTLR